jgi:hypothetical protein
MRPTARPETHQNLIYPDKDHGAHKTPTTARTHQDASEFLLLCDDIYLTNFRPLPSRMDRSVKKICQVLDDLRGIFACVCFAAAPAQGRRPYRQAIFDPPGDFRLRLLRSRIGARAPTVSPSDI